MRDGSKVIFSLRNDSWQTRYFSLLESPRMLYLLPLILAGIAGIVYLLTMAPGITWEHAGRDGGDFITAAWFLGVPHPTGYPTYTMLAWFFTRLPLGSVAWRVNLLSGFAGAGVVGLSYLLGRRAFAAQKDAPVVVGTSVGALLLAFSPLFWGHSLIAEVYALHLLFIALTLWLLLRWRDREGTLPLVALVFGVGMGNHITLVFLGPAILLLLWSGRSRLSWRDVLLSALALALGLLVYLYLPWRAAVDPIINWGDPDDWEGFKWMVTGQGYRRFLFALPGDELFSRLQDWWELSGAQFPALAWPLAVLGLWGLSRRDPWLALGTFSHALINLVYSVGYDVTDAFVHLLPVYFCVALWMGQGAAILLGATLQLSRWERKPNIISSLVLIGLLILPLVSLVKEWDDMDLTHERVARTYAQEALEAVAPGALILAGPDAHTFALWYYRYVEGLRPDVAVVNYAMMSFDWYRETIATYHPEVNQPSPSSSPEMQRDLALGNLEERAVYITYDEGQLTDLDVTCVGSDFLCEHHFRKVEK